VAEALRRLARNRTRLQGPLRHASGQLRSGASGFW
jgi:hypothetical protein